MTMLREIFAKPIDRPIDGVIKADDEASLKLELDEYVVTNEIAQRLERFLDAYNNYDNANGVWISGFFGSGKSHLLKMLAVILENREVEGARALDIFLSKKEFAENPMLGGALRKAVSIPSKSILFNIDQKADVISKHDVDALLSVFQKVFDEMCGYYGKQPYIAQFERDLDSRNLLSTFSQAFERLSGKPWVRGREQALFEKAHISKAFVEATAGNESDARDILDHYRKDTRVSIEDFASSVKAWIDAQPKNFRLNFFVDEVGQYIADNIKLMTNLQTVAESLNTKCQGQAWLVVTAQQDMASVIGDMTAQQESDFSKIQARFRTRMPLNSADVAEVIQRRLLEKNAESRIRVGAIFDKEGNNLKTIFDFSDNSFNFRGFRDKDHFTSSYPFPPYEYDLFQMAITGLSQHNAFEGRHSSVGERSMLGVFQEVAKKLADMSVGEFATFDLMFEGIRSALKSVVQQSIQIAERNLDDPMAVRVLKALFLVKYVNGFKPTVRNIAILLRSKLDADLASERREIEEALNTLERNTLIQRNGDVYEYLTDEEKDVEAEIKALDVDPSELSKELEELIFEAIIRARRIKHLTTGHEYTFSRKLDDHLLGREYELAINVISPLAGDASNREAIRMQSMSREELAVALEPDVRFVRDLTLYKKTDKFIRQARTGALEPGRERIVADKGEQNRRRHKELELRLRQLIADAPMYVRGDALDIAGADAQERITKAFQVLVDKVYTNLPMLRGVSYSEADIVKAALPGNSLFGSAGAGLTEPEQEVLNHAQSQARIGIKVSAKALSERFGSKPYGWPPNAVLCITASLCARDRLEARSDGTLLEGQELAKALRNSHILGNILLSPQVEFSAAQLRKAKDLYRELFDKPTDANDARGVGAAWLEELGKLSNEIVRLQANRQQYPFVGALDPLAALVERIKDKPAAWYVTDVAKHEDALLDAKEEILDPVRRFMVGPQKGIYDEVREFLRTQDANFAYVDAEKASQLRAVLDQPDCYKGSTVQDLKNTLHDLKAAVDLKVLEERNAVIAAVDECAAKLGQVPAFQALAQEKQDQILRQVESHKAGLDGIAVIAVLRDRASGVRSRLLQEALGEVDRLSGPIADPPPQPTTPPQPQPGDTGSVAEAPPKPIPAPKIKPRYVNAADVKVAYPKTYLEAEADVDAYVDEMRKKLLAEIRKGMKVIV